MGQAKRKKQQLGNAYGKTPDVVWHYTPEFRIYGICRDGLQDLYYGKDVVWHTSADTIDETSRLALSSGSLSALPGTFGRAWRVGIPGNLVEHFRSTTIVDNPSTFTIGIDPKITSQWYVSRAIAPDQITCFQVLVDGVWVDADPWLITEPDFVMAPKVPPRDADRRCTLPPRTINTELHEFILKTKTDSPVLFHSSGTHVLIVT